MANWNWYIFCNYCRNFKINRTELEPNPNREKYFRVEPKPKLNYQIFIWVEPKPNPNSQIYYLELDPNPNLGQQQIFSRNNDQEKLIIKYRLIPRIDFFRELDQGVNRVIDMKDLFLKANKQK